MSVTHTQCGFGDGRVAMVATSGVISAFDWLKLNKRTTSKTRRMLVLIDVACFKRLIIGEAFS